MQRDFQMLFLFVVRSCLLESQREALHEYFPWEPKSILDQVIARITYLIKGFTGLQLVWRFPDRSYGLLRGLPTSFLGTDGTDVFFLNNDRLAT
jgi:hypothetical protein